MIVESVYDEKKDPKKKDKCGLQRKREEVYIGEKRRKGLQQIQREVFWKDGGRYNHQSSLEVGAAFALINVSSKMSTRTRVCACCDAVNGEVFDALSNLGKAPKCGVGTVRRMSIITGSAPDGRRHCSRAL